MIRAPKNGYGFKEKQKYRHKVWSYFASKLNAETARVLILPSKEGLEIPIALSYGFKEENLIAVDDCPAVIATSKWRKEYPKIKFYGNKLSRAGERIFQDGTTIDAANLDLCGNISACMIDEFQRFVFSGCLSGKAIVSLTMLCGRESQAVNTLAELYLKAADHQYSTYSKFNKRIQVMCALIDIHGINIKYEHEEYYKSGNLKMVFGVFSILQDVYIEDLIEKNRENLEREIAPYCKVRNEHKDFRFFWKGTWSRRGYYFLLSLSCDDYKHRAPSKIQLSQAQDINDIYSAWLYKERKRLDDILEKLFLSEGKGWGSSFESKLNRRMLYPDQKNIWHTFYDDNFYKGCQGTESQDFCLNSKKAEKYLDKIGWDIKR